jgi:hypothetical protein
LESVTRPTDVAGGFSTHWGGRHVSDDLVAKRNGLSLGRTIRGKASYNARDGEGKNRSTNDEFHNGNLLKLIRKFVYLIPDYPEYSFRVA